MKTSFVFTSAYFIEDKRSDMLATPFFLFLFSAEDFTQTICGLLCSAGIFIQHWCSCTFSLQLGIVALGFLIIDTCQCSFSHSLFQEEFVPFMNTRGSSSGGLRKPSTCGKGIDPPHQLFSQVSCLRTALHMSTTEKVVKTSATKSRHNQTNGLHLTPWQLKMAWPDRIRLCHDAIPMWLLGSILWHGYAYYISRMFVALLWATRSWTKLASWFPRDFNTLFPQRYLISHDELLRMISRCSVGTFHSKF